MNLLLDSGRAPDGSAYEWSGHGKQIRGARVDGFCLRLAWPGSAGRRDLIGGHCEGPGRPLARVPYRDFRVGFVQGRGERSRARDVVVAGRA
jgi:hypothetical protein